MGNKRGELLNLLKENKNYRKLMTTSILTGLSTWGAFISMIVLLNQITETGIQLGTLWAISGLTPIFFSFFMGAWIDHLNTKQVIFLAELVKAPLFLGFILIPLFEGWSAWILFFLVRFLIDMCGSMTNIARQTIIPEIIDKEDLVVANSVSFTIQSSIRLLGAATGGILITIVNLNFFWIITSITFVISALLIKTIKHSNMKIKTKERNLLKEINFGLTVARKTPFVRFTLLAALSGGLIIGSFNLMIEQMTSKVYDAPPLGISILYVSEGLVSVALGIWIANKKILFNKVSNYGYIYILMGISWALFSLTQNVLQGAIVMMIFAFVGAFVVPFERMVMQTHVDSNVRGKIFGLWNICSMLSLQIGAFLTGVIIQKMGVTYVTSIVAIFEVIVGISFIINFKSERKGILMEYSPK